MDAGILTKMNMVRACLLVVFILVFSPAVFGETSREVVMYSGDTVSYEGYNIYLLESVSFGNLMIKVDGIPDFVDFVDADFADEVGVPVDGSIDQDERRAIRNKMQSEDLIVDLADPVGIRRNDLTVSLSRVCMGVHKSSCGRYNPQTMAVEPSYKLTITLAEPSLTVSTAYSQSLVLPGEEVSVTTTVTNDGDVPISSFRFAENFPTTVTIKIPSTITKVQNGFEYNIPLIKAGETKTISYKLSLSQPLEYSLKGSYSYKYRNETFTGFTANKNIALKKILTATLTAPSDVEIDNEEEIKLVVNNLVDQEVNYYFSLVIPPELNIKKLDGFTLDNGSYVAHGKIEGSDSVEHTIDIKFDDLGTYDISGKLVASMEPISRKVQDQPIPSQYFSETIVVVDEFSDFIFSARAKYKNVLENDTIPLEVHLLRSQNVELQNIRINVSGRNFQILPQSVQSLGSLKSNQKEPYHNFYYQLVAPAVDKKTVSQITIVVKAQVIPKDSPPYFKNMTISIPITVYDVSDAVFFDRIISPNSIKQNQTCMVTVFAKNNLDNRFFGNSYAKDFPPLGFVYKPIMSERFFTLLPNERKNLYSYELKAPYFVDPTVSEITTFYDIGVYNSTLYDDLSTRIDLKVPGISVGVSLPTGDMYSGDHNQLTMKVRNSGDLDIFRTTAHFPLFSNMDFVAERSVVGDNPTLEKLFTLNSRTVDFLEPSETVTFFGDYLLKYAAKESSTSSYSYHDVYGNMFRGKTSSLTSTILNGSTPCYLTLTKRLNVTLINNTFAGDSLVFMIDANNSCPKEATVSLDIPSLTFKVAPNAAKSISYTKSMVPMRGGRNQGDQVSDKVNFTEEAESNYVYTYGDEFRVSKTNLVAKKITIDLPEEKPKSQGVSNTGGHGTAVVPEETVTLESQMPSLAKRFVAILILFFFVALVMLIAMKLLSKRKTARKKKDDLAQIREEMIIPPAVGEGIDALDTFIKGARTNAVPDIEIEQSLLLKGWSKNVIDAFMKK